MWNCYYYNVCSMIDGYYVEKKDSHHSLTQMEMSILYVADIFLPS